MCRCRAHRLSACLILLSLAATSGCTTTRERSVARYELGAAPKVQQAPDGGIFKVKWANDAKGPFKTGTHTTRLVATGEKVSFATDDGGRVFAVAGREWFPLDRLPKDARYCAWTYQVDKETARQGAQDRRQGDWRRRARDEAAVLIALEAATAYASDDAGDEGTDDRDHHHGHGHPKPKPHPGKTDDGNGSGN